MNKRLLGLISIVFIIIIVAGFAMYEGKKSEDTKEKQIVAFGDSLTYGSGDEKGSGYLGSLKTMLNERKQNVHYKITNHAVYGLESSGVLKQLSDIRVTAELGAADYIILFIGTNDLLNSNGGGLKSINEEKIAYGKEVFVDNLAGILKILQSENEEAPILLVGLYNPYPHKESYDKIFKNWNKEIVSVAKSNSRIKYIETNNLFERGNKKQYFSDSLHLNDKGYDKIAERLLEKGKFQ
ncbi:GDSL-type esterase/lipase family protein [Bacillus massilinigeriensis]|uniref:GDSL-type esterase/lipase family protein n=1 Tax=Bacillus mediterraneensis TaxID=1805474 RepID=UPI0008F86F36|nr:GDSL-type esterase/lipase family protein [Bacillus mediterraneensis]